RALVSFPTRRSSDLWARLAEAYMIMAVTFEPGVRWVRRGDRAIRRALKLDPRNAEAHCERGRALWTPAGNFRNRAALRALSAARSEEHTSELQSREN